MLKIEIEARKLTMLVMPPPIDSKMPSMPGRNVMREKTPLSVLSTWSSKSSNTATPVSGVQSSPETLEYALLEGAAAQTATMARMTANRLARESMVSGWRGGGQPRVAGVAVGWAEYRLCDAQYRTEHGVWAGGRRQTRVVGDEVGLRHWHAVRRLAARLVGLSTGGRSGEFERVAGGMVGWAEYRRAARVSLRLAAQRFKCCLVGSLHRSASVLFRDNRFQPKSVFFVNHNGRLLYLYNNYLT